MPNSRRLPAQIKRHLCFGTVVPLVRRNRLNVTWDVRNGSEADGNLRIDCGPKEMGSFSLTRRDDYVVPVRNLRWQIQCCPF